MQITIDGKDVATLEEAELLFCQSHQRSRAGLRCAHHPELPTGGRMNHFTIIVDGVRISMRATSAFNALDQAMGLFPTASRIEIEKKQ
jgi:hypothetical protein